MIRSRKWMLASLAIAPAFGCLYYCQGRPAPLLEDGDSRDWQPTAAAIRSELGPLPRAADHSAGAARRELFALRFKQRYRSRQNALAVCLHFLPDGRVKLMCPARMEPWQLDRLAQSAFSETRDDFGHAFAIDIYETYIGAATVKIGEVRTDPKRPQMARITYPYPVRAQSVSSAF